MPFISIIRFLLYPFALIYGAVVWLRNRLYDSGFSTSVEFDVPVICVGNLSVGGTGKTPHVEYLVRLLQYQYKVATMSRGYKRRTQGFLLADEQTNALRIGDEPMQYHLKFPELTVSVAEERMTGIPQLIQRRPDTEIVLLDDAYQHRSVRAGMNVLITDYNRPFYTDYILPFGRLREGRKAYERADVIIVSKCPPSLTKAEADGMRAKIAPLDYQQVYYSAIRYDAPYDFFSRAQVSLENKSALLICAIAKPAPLLAFLESAARAVHPLTYPDHHFFLSKDLEEIKSVFDGWEAENKMIITTEKDAARLHLHRKILQGWGIEIAVLPIEIFFLFDAGHSFDARVMQYVHQSLPQPDLLLPE